MTEFTSDYFGELMAAIVGAIALTLGLAVAVLLVTGTIGSGWVGLSIFYSTVWIIGGTLILKETVPIKPRTYQSKR